MLVAATLVLALGGASPAGGVIDGGYAMYGATTIGGPHCITDALSDRTNVGCGVVFRLTYDGSGYTVIHAFDGSDGKYPIGPLLLARDGRLYGRTMYGGANGDGVIYSVDRDGSGFQVLYAFAKEASDVPAVADLPSLVGSDSGAIFAVTGDAQGARRVVRIAGGTAKNFMTFLPGTRIIDLKAFGESVYALLDQQKGCGDEIDRLDAPGVATRLLANTPEGDAHLCYPHYAAILPDGSGGVYALNAGGVDRVNRGQVTPFFRLPTIRSRHPGSTGGFATALAQDLSGRLLVTVSPAFELNCGTLLSVDSSGHAQALVILPPIDRAPYSPCSPNAEPWLTLAHTGDVYLTTQAIGCNSPAESINDSCGSILVLRRSGGVYTLRDFGTQLRSNTLATPQPGISYDTLQTTPDPYRLLLTRTSEDRDFTARTPEPRAIGLRSLTIHTITPLGLEGATTARKMFRPLDPPIPAVAYRVPEVGADMYDAGLPVNGYWSNRVY